MRTEISDIDRWFREGVRLGATHMIVVCDSFSHEDYPVYVGTDMDIHQVVASKNGSNMQRVMEVYNLSKNKQIQLNEHRSFNY